MDPQCSRKCSCLMYFLGNWDTLRNLGKAVDKHGDIHPKPKQLKQFLAGCVRLFMAQLRNECTPTELQHSFYAMGVRFMEKYCQNCTQHPVRSQQMVATLPAD